MSDIEDHPVRDDITILLDRLAAAEPVQANCMFQLALMLARIAVEPCSEAYKEEVAHTLMGVVRAKPKSNVVRLFGSRSEAASKFSGARSVG